MLFLFILYFSNFEGPGWTIKIEPVQYEYYIREPMWFVIEGINETGRELKSISKEGFIEFDDKYCGRAPDNTALFEIVQKMVKPGEEIIYPPKAIKRVSFTLGEICQDISKIGVPWAEERDEFYGMHKLCYVRKWKEFSRQSYKWEDKEQRFCTEFKITYPPEGEDRDFYNKYFKKRHLFDVTYLSESEKLEAVEEFPTSYYTGWILDNFYPLLTMYDFKYIIIELKKPIEERGFYKEKKEEYLRMKRDPKKAIKIYAKSAEKFQEKHKNHPLRALIYGAMAYEYINLGDKKKAIKYGKEALKLDFPQWYKYFNYDYTGDILSYNIENLRKLIEEIEKQKNIQ